MRIREKRTHFRQGKPRLTRGKRGGGESRGERKDRSVWRGEIEAHDGDERKSARKEERSRWELEGFLGEKISCERMSAWGHHFQTLHEVRLADLL